MADNGRPVKSGPSVTDQEALKFHAEGRPGKLEITPTKPMATQRDLSLAYSPGVAYPCLAIQADPDYLEAHLSLGLLLSRRGDVAEGRSHLAKAAASADPAVRAAAVRALASNPQR